MALKQNSRLVRAVFCLPLSLPGAPPGSLHRVTRLVSLSVHDRGAGASFRKTSWDSISPRGGGSGFHQAAPLCGWRLQNAPPWPTQWPPSLSPVLRNTENGLKQESDAKEHSSLSFVITVTGSLTLLFLFSLRCLWHLISLLDMHLCP